MDRGLPPFMTALAIGAAVALLMALRPAPAIAQQALSAAEQKWYNDRQSASSAFLSAGKIRATDEAAAAEYRQKAFAALDTAFADAPTDEHRADTLLAMAEGYETIPDRAKAIETYARLVNEYPASGHVPAAYARLGDLYASIMLAPFKCVSDEKEVIRREMTPDRAIPYFEKAVATGSPTSRAVLRSKSALVSLYARVGRKDDGWRILDEFARLKVEDVKEPDYVGPYRMIHDRPMTTSQRIDLARKYAAQCIEGTPEVLVNYCIERDKARSVENLQSLAARYPGTAIEAAAQKEAARISQEMSAQAATKQ